MPALTISIHDDSLRAMLAKMNARISNRSPLLAIIGEIGVDYTQRTFEDEGYPARSWKKSIRARATGDKTLTDKGQLKGSINYRIASGRVTIGTNKIYGAIHQFGGIIRAKHKPYLWFRLQGTFGFESDRRSAGIWRRVKQVTIPARPFLHFRSDMMQRICEATGDYLRLTGAK